MVGNVMRRPSTFQALMFQAAFGSYLLWAAGTAIPLIRIDFGISRTLASFHSISTGLGAVLGALFAGRLVEKLSREIVMRLSILVILVGSLGLLLGQSIWITIPSCGIAALSQTIVNAISLAEISHDDKPSLRRIFIQSGIQAAVGASAIFFMSASLHADLGWRLPIFIGAVLLSPISLFMIWRVKFIVAPVKASTVVTNSTDQGVKYKIFLLGLMMSFLDIGVGFWAIDLLISRGAGVALGAFGSALLSISIAGCRIGLAILNLRVKRIMHLAILFYFVGVAVICITNSPSITMAGLFIAGAGSSPLFVSGVFQVSEGFPDPSYRISRYMMGTAFSYGLSPFVLAIVFDNAGFVAGYLMLPVVLVFAYLLWRRLGLSEAHQSRVTSNS